MNNEYIRIAAAGVGGLLVGGGVTFLLTRKHFEELAQREIDQVKEAFGTLSQNLERETTELLTTEEPEAEPVVVVEGDVEITNLVMGREGDTRMPVHKTPYHQIVEKLEYTGAEKPTPTVVVEREAPVGPLKLVQNSSLPFVIDDESYSNPPNGWTTVTIEWYKLDQVLCEEDNTIISDELALIGDEAWGMLQDVTNLQPIYVRNSKIETDFEISQIPGEYSILVAGT